ncbi:MAG TPA: Hsp20/alpha crystallin family protein [Usitatibacter sp.]|jgi:HSP20 family protein|nr:Hsp20/alpha crystallin family protein [Usitatibacter sp.]
MNTLTRYEPLVGRLDGLFNEFFRPAFVWEDGAAAQPLPIRVDVKETAEAYTVSAELPGLKKDEIAVEIEGNEVTISAETRREPARDGEKFLRLERTFGKTARRFALPQDLDETKAVAKFTDGVLELTLPKKAAVTGRKLTIG